MLKRRECENCGIRFTPVDSTQDECDECEGSVRASRKRKAEDAVQDTAGQDVDPSDYW